MVHHMDGIIASDERLANQDLNHADEGYLGISIYITLPNLVNVYITNWNDPPFLTGISRRFDWAIVDSYAKIPEDISNTLW